MQPADSRGKAARRTATRVGDDQDDSAWRKVRLALASWAGTGEPVKDRVALKAYRWLRTGTTAQSSRNGSLRAQFTKQGWRKMFSRMPVHCPICKGEMDGMKAYGRDAHCCDRECGEEWEWRKTLAIMGKAYYRRPGSRWDSTAEVQYGEQEETNP